MRIYDIDGKARDIPYDIQDMFRNKQYILAIKALRDEFMLGLKQAKELADMVRARLKGEGTFPEHQFRDGNNEIIAFLKSIESRIIALEQAFEILDKRTENSPKGGE